MLIVHSLENDCKMVVGMMNSTHTIFNSDLIVSDANSLLRNSSSSSYCFIPRSVIEAVDILVKYNFLSNDTLFCN